jgi:hypothetical protein
MTVENKVVDHNAGAKDAADLEAAVLFNGGKLRCIPFSFEVAAADSDGSVYRFARISPMAIVKSIMMISDAIAGMTDLEIGFYKPLELGGTVIDQDCLKGSVDLNAGLAALTEEYVPTIADVGKRAYELAGLTAYEEYGAFDVAVTLNTAGSAAGTISGFLTIIEP